MKAISNQTPMTRKEGIIKRYEAPENSNLRIAVDNDIDKAIMTEYKNYTENCYYCSEEPKPFEEWANETIKEWRDEKI